jgi:hypothetical protein
MSALLEQKLFRMLDALADGAKLQRASRSCGMGNKFIFAAIKQSKAGNPLYLIEWRDEGSRWFHELVPFAQNMGRVAREQRLRGVTIDGVPQFVLDPALLARFGSDDDSKDMAELAGFPDFPFAHDIAGNRIPLLSARFPRPQRQHRPNSPPRNAVSEQSCGADSRRTQSAAGKPLREWRPDDPLPAYAREVYTPTPPPIVHIPTPSSPKAPKADSPLVADLRRHLERAPLHPRPVDNAGRPTMPARVIGSKADDPPELITGRG